MQRRFIGIKDLAVYLDVKPATVKSWVYKGEVPSVKMGRLIKFDLTVIEGWIQEHTRKCA